MKALLAIAAALTVAAPAAAAPTFFAGTGHYYDYVGTGLSWTAARAAALAADGYLATITSDAENTFLGTLAGDGWIGATDQATEGTFVWADGPEAGTLPYTHWNSGEPNDFFGEDYTQYQGGNWNDLPDGSARGYFIEYNVSAAPEPATWGMMLLGFGLVGAAARRRRRTPAAA